MRTVPEKPESLNSLVRIPEAPEATSARMRRQATRDTAPEIALRRSLHRRGLRFRLHQQVLPSLRSRPDIAFPRARVAVYVNGCFWHGCPDHGTWPTRNAEFWRSKIRTNEMRDARIDQVLDDSGWQVVRIWEHEKPDDAVPRIELAVRNRLTSR